MNNLFFLFILLLNNNENQNVLVGEPMIFNIVISAEQDIRDDEKESLKYQYLKDLKGGKISEESYNKLSDSVTNLQLPEFNIKGTNSNWTEAINFEIYDKDSDTWNKLEWNLQLLTVYPDSITAKIYTDNYLTADFGLDPDIVSRINPGQYMIRSKMQVYNLKENIYQDAISSQIEVNIKQELANLQDIEVVEYRTHYYKMSNQFDKAAAEANKLFSMKIDSFQVYGYLGQIYERQRECEKALNNYNEALSKIPEGYPEEYADFFMGKIDELERHINCLDNK